jgi:oligopeptide/dipeptide ABC transporter ATP-binding protein
LLKSIQKEQSCSFLYISHDLTTVRYLADRIAVMYLGRIVETGVTEEIFDDPRHPYTKALLDSAPTLDKLMHLPEAIPGEIPDPRIRFVGCRFAGRCRNAQTLCEDQDPPATQELSRAYYCHYPVKKPKTSGGLAES